MLTRTTAAVRVAARALVMRHPNAFAVQVMRRTVTRTLGNEDGPVGGLPSMGGMGVLNNDDEPEFSYTLLGEGRLLFAGVIAPAKLADSRGFSDSPEVTEACFEPLAAGELELRDSDLLMVTPGGGAVVPYEVTRVLSVVHIPPYVQRVELSQMGEPVFDQAVAQELATRG